MVFRRLTYILLAGCLLMLSACTDDEGQGMESQKAFIQVHIGLSAKKGGMRGTPAGGEDGDGRETGINNENKVYSVTLLLFESDVTTNTNAVVSRILHFSSEQLQKVDEYTYELKEPYPIEAEFKTYYVIAVVNDSHNYSGKTFSQIANIIVANPWRGNGNTADYFVMSSTQVSTLTLYEHETKGTYADPFITETNVCRLAARIDIDATGSNSDGDFIYDYKNTADVKIGTVVVKDIQAFNLLNDGTYLLKHYSTDGTLEKLNFFSSEGTSPAQSQYVLDPHTLAKTTSATPTYYTNWFNSISDLETDITWGTPTLTADKTVASGTDVGHKYFILTYLQENTLPQMVAADVETMLPKYATVLAIHYQTIENAVATDHYDSYYLLHNNGATTPADTDLMRYSIVRNNIYRVTLEPPIKDSKALTIKVKKWDPFTHEVIFM